VAELGFRLQNRSCRTSRSGCNKELARHGRSMSEQPHKHHSKQPKNDSQTKMSGKSSAWPSNTALDRCQGLPTSLQQVSIMIQFRSCLLRVSPVLRHGLPDALNACWRIRGFGFCHRYTSLCGFSLVASHGLTRLLRGLFFLVLITLMCIKELLSAGRVSMKVLFAHFSLFGITTLKHSWG
jgi:hypothetical protein